MSGGRCPECRAGKHGNCTGWALGPDDEMVACPCECQDGLGEIRDFGQIATKAAENMRQSMERFNRERSKKVRPGSLLGHLDDGLNAGFPAGVISALPLGDLPSAPEIPRWDSPEGLRKAAEGWPRLLRAMDAKPMSPEAWAAMLGTPPDAEPPPDGP